MTELTIPFLGETPGELAVPVRGAGEGRRAHRRRQRLARQQPRSAARRCTWRSTAALPEDASSPFLPEQAISLRTALAAYTAGSARINGLENTVGLITARLRRRPRDRRRRPRRHPRLRNLPGVRAPDLGPRRARLRCRRTDDKTAHASFAGVAAVASRSTLLASACGRSLSSATTGAGNISPTANLVTTTPAGDHAGRAGRLGGLPGRQQPGPGVRVRLPGEHGDLADVRVAAAAAAGRRDRARPGEPQHSPTDNAMSSPSSRGPPSGTATRSPRPTSSTAWTGSMSPSLGGFYGAGIQPRQVDRADRPGPGDDHPEPARLLAARASCRRWPGSSSRSRTRRPEGKNYGTPAGGIMCTGRTSSSPGPPAPAWSPTANPHYWRGTTPLVEQIILSGVPDNNDLTAGLETGAIQGTYASGGIPTLDSAQEEQRGEGLPGTRLGDRRDDHLRHRRPAGQRQGPSGALAGAQPAVDHQRGVQGRRADAEVAGEPGRLRLRHRGLRPGLPGVAGPQAEPGRGEEAHRAGGRGRADGHDRHVERGVEHRVRGRRLPAGGQSRSA